MNVYDFDKTIYKNDSSIDFYIYNLRKNSSLIKFIPSQLKGLLEHYLFNKITIKEMKQNFYQYLSAINDVEKEAEVFWNENFNKINKWYLSQKREDDVIISASPYFLIKIAADKLGVKYVIASEVDSDGIYHSENCRDEEKVRRFIEYGFDINDVDNFYSDSMSDLPFAKVAKKAYLVNKEKISEWHIK